MFTLLANCLRISLVTQATYSPFEFYISHHDTANTFLDLQHGGVGIAIIKIVTAGNIEGQFKVCGSCLQEYIDEQAKK
jgi:hypothetical protein